jgi:hypothetical protein
MFDPVGIWRNCGRRNHLIEWVGCNPIAPGASLTAQWDCALHELAAIHLQSSGPTMLDHGLPLPRLTVSLNEKLTLTFARLNSARSQ